MATTVLFFGSFQHYSTIVAEALHRERKIKLLGVVTAPPRPAGRGLKLTKTHTHEWAQAHDLPVFTPGELNENWKLKIENSVGRPDFIVVAGYRLLLPPAWLEYPKRAPLNLHHSLLPQYAGPSPAEWALLRGDKFTGISIIKMTEEYDQGPIIVQKKLSILPSDTRLSLYQKLYELGAEIIFQKVLSSQLSVLSSIKTQPKIQNLIYARRLHRDDGYIPWSQAQAALTGDPKVAAEVERKIRALSGYPGVWTKTPQTHKRLKLLSLTQVQLEGKKPTAVSLPWLASLA